jgi:hypothetical protein
MASRTCRPHAALPHALQLAAGAWTASARANYYECGLSITRAVDVQVFRCKLKGTAETDSGWLATKVRSAAADVTHGPFRVGVWSQQLPRRCATSLGRRARLLHVLRLLVASLTL